jgi:Na+/H+ antiporter NhaD/arsenite permease-like protein
MKKVFEFLKKEIMLTVAVLAAVVSLFITPPTKALIKEIDWHTLGTLFMMLCVLEGFKQENIFEPVINFSKKFKTMATLSLFLIFGVFFTSMFVTNDVSLIIFVPLTILLFRKGDKEKYILPVISMENIAAIRGSLLMPFGSPQNLFLFGQSNISVWHFMLHMSPLCVGSGILLIIFVLVLYRKNVKEEFKTVEIEEDKKEPVSTKIKIRKIAYLVLFAMIILTIVTRTKYWPIAVAIVIIVIAAVNIKLFVQVDYVLIFTFLCFFVFSSSIAANPKISDVLNKAVAGNEYWWAIGLSQIISNVPASIVLYPFTKNFAGLIYGADTAGLVSLIGSLASVINYRIYVREYPDKGFKFIKVFTLVSWAFFIIVVIPGFFLSRWKFF